MQLSHEDGVVDSPLCHPKLIKGGSSKRNTTRHAFPAPHLKREFRRIKPALIRTTHTHSPAPSHPMADSGQFLTVPSTRHRSSQHHRRDSARASAQSPRSQRSATARGVASSSKVKLEDTPLGMCDSTPASTGPPPSPPPSTTTTTTSTTTKVDNDTTTTTSTSSTSSPSSPHSSRRTSQAQRQARLAVATSSPPNVASPPPASSPPQSVQLSPRSIFRAMPFLLRLRSPPSDLMTMTCTSGGPRTHAVLSKCQIDRASQALTYNKTIVCADAVNAEVLLRLARNELLERAQEANRQVTALVDEEYVSLF
jgi:hypothetical protein